MNDFDDEHDALFCPKCGRDYDEIDADFLICSKCGFDAEKKEVTKPRTPTKEDYFNGDADLFTGQFI